MPCCIVLDQISGEVKIYPYPKGDRTNIQDFLVDKGMDMDNINYMCVDELIIRMEE